MEIPLKVFCAPARYTRGPHATAQLGAEIYNLPNHPNFCNPLLPGYLAAAGYNGVNPANGRGMGFLPITATADVGIGNPFLGGGGPRGIQLALKLTF